MTIFLCCQEARQPDSYAHATIQIPSYLIAREIDSGGRILVYRVFCFADQFPIVIKQFMKGKVLYLLGKLTTSLKNARLQLLQINLIAGNWQYAFKEVFHVHS